MPENKFKAWHKVAKEMLIHACQSHLFRWAEDGQPVKLMQYTGLKDKNSKEIYFDCEIFKFKNMTSPSKSDELIGVMTWSDDELRAEIDIYPEDNDQGYICLSYIGNGQMYDFEVIGNIYENPELKK